MERKIADMLELDEKKRNELIEELFEYEDAAIELLKEINSIKSSLLKHEARLVKIYDQKQRVRKELINM